MVWMLLILKAMEAQAVAGSSAQERENNADPEDGNEEA